MNQRGTVRVLGAVLLSLLGACSWLMYSVPSGQARSGVDRATASSMQVQGDSRTKASTGGLERWAVGEVGTPKSGAGAGRLVAKVLGGAIGRASRVEVVGVVVDNRGIPVGGAGVELVTTPKPVGSTTDAFGRFSLPAMHAPGTPRLLIRHPAFAPTLCEPSRGGANGSGSRVDVGRLVVDCGGTVGVGPITSEAMAPVSVELVPAIGHSLRAASGRGEPDAFVVEPGMTMRVEHVAPGPYELRLTSLNCPPTVVSDIWVANGRRVAIGPVRVTRGVSLQGRVVDASGRPIERARVVVSSQGVEPLRVESNADGRIRVAGLAPEKAAVNISAAGFSSGRFEVDLAGEGGDGADVVFPLDIGVELTVELVGPSGCSLEDGLGTVRVVPADRSPGVLEAPIRSGRAAILGLDRGTYELAVEMDDGQIATQVIHVPAGVPSLTRRVVVEERVELRGRVARHSDGAPICGARVGFQPTSLGRGVLPSRATTDAKGDFRLSLVRGVSGTLSTSQAGYTSTRRTLRVDDDGTRVEVRVVPQSALTGRVELAGSSASGVRVIAIGALDALHSAKLRRDGSYALEGLPAGAMRVYAFRGETAEFLRETASWVYGPESAWPPSTVDLVAGERHELNLALVLQRRAKLVREVDVGPSSGLEEMSAVLMRVGDDSVVSPTLQRIVARVPADGRVRFEWDDLAYGDYRLTLAAVGMHRSKLYSEHLLVDRAWVNSPPLALELGQLCLVIREGSEQPLAVVISQAGTPPIRMRLRAGRHTIAGLRPGSAWVAIDVAGDRVFEQEALTVGVLGGAEVLIQTFELMGASG